MDLCETAVLRALREEVWGKSTACSVVCLHVLPSELAISDSQESNCCGDCQRVRSRQEEAFRSALTGCSVLAPFPSEVQLAFELASEVDSGRQPGCWLSLPAAVALGPTTSARYCLAAQQARPSSVVATWQSQPCIKKSEPPDLRASAQHSVEAVARVGTFRHFMVMLRL
jgi:hypothetical protein